MSKFKTHPDSVDHCEVVDVEIIERWREFVKCKNDAHKHRTIDAIFDCAVQGASEAKDADKLARKMFRQMLRDLAKSVKTR